MNWIRGMFLVLVISLFGKINCVQAQTLQQIDALNYYIDFVNASSHGLGIALLLAETLNCEVLEKQGKTCEQQVRITVEDIPKNLFDKPDDNSVFYKISPLEIAEKAKKESVILESTVAAQLNKDLKHATFILNEVNSLLYKLDNLKKTENLKKKKSQERYYKDLESLAKLFRQFKDVKKKIVDLVYESCPPPESKLYPVLIQYRNCAADVLDSVLEGDLLSDGKPLENYDLVSSNVMVTLNSIKEAIGKEYPVLNEQIKEFDEKSSFFRNLIDIYFTERQKGSTADKEKVSLEYYNRMCKITFNQTGPGIVTIFKEILNFLSLKGINFDEQVVIYKVNYPSK